MENLKEKKQTHLLLHKTNYIAFRELCKRNFTTVSAEVNRFIKQKLEENKA